MPYAPEPGRSYAPDSSIPASVAGGGGGVEYAPASGNFIVEGELSASNLNSFSATVQNAIRCQGNVSGFNGLRYIMFNLGTTAAPTTISFNGSAFFINPNPAGDGSGTILIDLPFLLNDGLPIFKFVNTSPNTQTVKISINGNLLTIPTAEATITELIYNSQIAAPNNLMYWGYNLLTSGPLSGKL